MLLLTLTEYRQAKACISTIENILKGHTWYESWFCFKMYLNLWYNRWYFKNIVIKKED